MNYGSRGLLVAALLASTSCDSQANDLASNRAPPGRSRNPGQTPSREGANDSTGGWSADAPSWDGSVDALGIPTDMYRRGTIWIGEIESSVTFPAESGAPEKVVLILDALADGVSGTIAFSEGPLPSPDPRAVYPGGVSGFPNWMTVPFPGFPYSLRSSQLVGNVFAIDFLPNEVWTAWCGAPTPPPLEPLSPCDCSGASCRVLEDSILATLSRLDLQVTGGDMQGQYRSRAIKLTRVK